MLGVAIIGLLSGARDAGTVAASPPTTTIPDIGPRQAAVRLGWIVTMRDPVPAEAGAVACVTAGAACDLDGMLATDSARLQAAALAADLGTAIDPLAPGFDPLPPDATRRARNAAALAQRAADALDAWLSAGCGSLVDGVPVPDRPSDCDDRTAAALGSLAGLRSALTGWPR